MSHPPSSPMVEAITLIKLILGIVFVRNIGVFGPTEGECMNLLTLSAIREIRPGEFLERIEAAAIFILTFGIIPPPVLVVAALRGKSFAGRQGQPPEDGGAGGPANKRAYARGATKKPASGHENGNKNGGRHWNRTSDLSDVNAAL